MLKKVLLGFSALVLMMVLAAAAAMVFLDWDKTGAGGGAGADGESPLARNLEKEFASRPTVAFVCRFPVVGIAPCVLDGDMGSREVALTFTDYKLPDGTTAEEQARRIAVLAFETSAFARGAERTDVTFEGMEGSDSAIVSRKYSFRGEDLAADGAPLSGTADDSQAPQD